MIEEVSQHIYKITIPLPNSPLKALNSYLIKGDGRFLLIDTGMNRQECLDAMTAALKKLEVDTTKTDFFITHVHSDHLGLAGTLKTPTSKVYLSALEDKLVNITPEESEHKWRGIYNTMARFGYPENELLKSWENHPGKKYGGNCPVIFTHLQENDILSIGDYTLRLIQTPGHSPCHQCLYDEKKQILFCGDHILFDITPNITYWDELDNALKSYLDNLDKVAKLDVKLVLPGHRRIMNDHLKRIEELKRHHAERLKEALTALADGDKSAWEVAPHIAWDIKAASWEVFPPAQKWFAFGETIAHMQYLEKDGKIKSRLQKGKIIYSRVN